MEFRCMIVLKGWESRKMMWDNQVKNCAWQYEFIWASFFVCILQKVKCNEEHPLHERAWTMEEQASAIYWRESTIISAEGRDNPLWNSYELTDLLQRNLITHHGPLTLDCMPWKLHSVTYFWQPLSFSPRRDTC